jgi:hypothetical protein
MQSLSKAPIFTPALDATAIFAIALNQALQREHNTVGFKINSRKP